MANCKASERNDRQMRISCRCEKLWESAWSGMLCGFYPFAILYRFYPEEVAAKPGESGSRIGLNGWRLT
jgi:hypothetical protein